MNADTCAGCGHAGHRTRCVHLDCDCTLVAPSAVDTTGGYPAGSAPVSSIRKPPQSVSQPTCSRCGTGQNAHAAGIFCPDLSEQLCATCQHDGFHHAYQTLATGGRVCIGYTDGKMCRCAGFEPSGHFQAERPGQPDKSGGDGAGLTGHQGYESPPTPHSCINPAHAPDCPGEHHPLEDVFSTVTLRAAERLFGADSNATLGMDPVRYLRHQRDECPADEPCALCMYELAERMYHQAIDARDEAHRALHRVRQLCDDPEIPHACSCASYRVFKAADGPYPCDCIVASIRRALP